MIKVNYDIETNLVKGYYPDSIKYKSIPEPYVEIEDIEQINDKQMCVIDGVYQEYIKQDSELLKDAKTSKLADLKAYRDSELSKSTPQTVTYEGNLANKVFDISPKEHLPLFNSFIAKLQRAIDGLVEGDKTIPTRSFTDASGTRLDLTIKDFKDLANHLDLRDEIEYNLYSKRRKTIESLTTVKAVEDYDITTTDFE